MIRDIANNTIRRLRYLANKIRKMLLEPVLGYTRMVFATKYILSFIATALILVLIVFPLINPVHDNFRITFNSVEELPDGEEAKMINPRFQGIDKDDQTYNITSDYALKKDGDSFILKNINADINLRDHSWVALIANTGFFDHKNESLDLQNSVNLFSNDGYEFYTKSLHINIAGNYAYSDSKVHGSGPIGSITANKVYLYDKGERVVFKGDVDLVLYPDSKAYFGVEDE